MKGGGDFSIGSQVWPGASKVIEEMGELQQVMGKLIGTAGEEKHWDGSDLKERLKEELADVSAAIAFFIAKNFEDTDDREMILRVANKKALFFKWHNKPEEKGGGM